MIQESHICLSIKRNVFERSESSSDDRSQIRPSPWHSISVVSKHPSIPLTEGLFLWHVYLEHVDFSTHRPQSKSLILYLYATPSSMRRVWPETARVNSTYIWLILYWHIVGKVCRTGPLWVERNVKWEQVCASVFGGVPYVSWRPWVWKSGTRYQLSVLVIPTSVPIRLHHADS